MEPADAQRLFKSFLARNKRADEYGVWDLRASRSSFRLSVFGDPLLAITARLLYLVSLWNLLAQILQAGIGRNSKSGFESGRWSPLLSRSCWVCY
jgi:hypothetical protein